MELLVVADRICIYIKIYIICWKKTSSASRLNLYLLTAKLLKTWWRKIFCQQIESASTDLRAVKELLKKTSQASRLNLHLLISQQLKTCWKKLLQIANWIYMDSISTDITRFEAFLSEQKSSNLSARKLKV